MFVYLQCNQQTRVQTHRQTISINKYRFYMIILKINDVVILRKDYLMAELIVVRAKMAKIGITGYDDVWNVYSSYFPDDVKANIMPLFSMTRKINEDVLEKFKHVLEEESKKSN